MLPGNPQADLRVRNDHANEGAIAALEKFQFPTTPISTNRKDLIIRSKRIGYRKDLPTTMSSEQFQNSGGIAKGPEKQFYPTQ